MEINEHSFDKMKSLYGQLQEDYYKKSAQKEALEKQANELSDDITKLEDDNYLFKKVMLVLTESSNIAREKAKVHFEKIITEALQYITQSTDYEFVIQEKKERSKASYEFYVKTIINGEESLQSPIDANGGGFVDIISVAAKYAYLELFNDPKIQCGTVFLDEPGKMVDEQRSIKFAEYIRELGNEYNKQTIMITHNTSLKDVANETYFVSQDSSLMSNVSIIDDVPLENIEDSVKEILDGH